MTVDRLITQQTVAAALRMSQSNVRRWIGIGKLPALDLSIARNLCGWWPETLQSHDPQIAAIVTDHIAAVRVKKVANP